MVEFKKVDGYYMPEVFLKEDYDRYKAADLRLQQIHKKEQDEEERQLKALSEMRETLIAQLTVSEGYKDKVAVPTQYNYGGSNERRQYPLTELVENLNALPNPLPSASMQIGWMKRIIENCIALLNNATAFVEAEDDDLVKKAKLAGFALQERTAEILGKLDEFRNILLRSQKDMQDAMEQKSMLQPSEASEKHSSLAFQGALEQLHGEARVAMGETTQTNINNNFRSFLTFLSEKFKQNTYPYGGIDLDRALKEYAPLSNADFLTEPVRKKIEILKAIVAAHSENLSMMDPMNNDNFNTPILQHYEELERRRPVEVHSPLEDNHAHTEDQNKADANLHHVKKEAKGIDEVKAEILKLLQDYLEARESYREPNKTIKEYLRPSFLPFQKSYREKLAAVNALRQALDGSEGYVDLAQHLSTIRNGNLGKNLREYIKAGRANALSKDNSPITTVREFVDALQHQVNESIASKPLIH